MPYKEFLQSGGFERDQCFYMKKLVKLSTSEPPKREMEKGKAEKALNQNHHSQT